MAKKNSFYNTLIFTTGILISAVLVTNTWQQNSRSNQSIQVTGSAKRMLTSDEGVVRANLQVERSSQLQAYRDLQAQRPVVLAFLKKEGFTDKDIQFFPPSNYVVYDYNNQGMQIGVRAYVYQMSFSITSKDVKRIETLSFALSSLIEQNIQIQTESTQYYYSALAEIKVEIQAEAAKDAMERAARIAEATGRRLGPLNGARMGVLQITPPNTNAISDYGMNDASSIEKEITAVVSGTFLIK